MNQPNWLTKWTKPAHNWVGALALGALMLGPIHALADEVSNSASARDAVESAEPVLSYETSYNLIAAIKRYEQIVANGGWEEMSRGAFALKKGDDRGHVRALRRRLIASGDLEDSDRLSSEFDDELDAALRRFQARHGLHLTGVIDQETYLTLNVPAETKLAQLKLNLERVNQVVGELSNRYIVVNIPAASIEAVENGIVERRHTAIVGRIDRQTPILTSKVHEINFNPYWHVPKSIIRRDIIKYMNQDPNYLTDYRIKIYDANGEELDPQSIDWSTDEAVQYLFRQEPGAENSMGHVKINFHNPHAVYLHDTPQKSLFGQNRRFHSSGCVRVEDVDKLVSWLLRENETDWSLPAVDAAFDSGERMDVRLEQPVPIITTYITAWANRDGVVSFRSDIYGYDEVGRVDFASAE
ncbi:L,D-transpeptidase family protein [Maritalea mediterranea]|uniref:L,D-transpeptidase family protein n=1 Tax=Maritalea mediterranea TaxID=2909667 RepID=A0ABS9E5T8_9HYPH|nr:L,D-transpeptidase family protein [Maritalea mediterranea]MCF4098177.1 L,D-transpeptidase family protein [Maritalea mediterranea]